MKLTLLHLTDLHFGAPEAKGHYWNSEATELELAPHNRRGLLGSLVRDLRKQEIRPDVVIVTGDLLDRGSEAGVQLAVDFLAGLAERLELPRTRFVLIPGNHDVLRSPEPARRYVAYDAVYTGFYGALRPRIDPKVPPHLRVERFDYAGELGVEVIGLNSCEELDPEAGQHHGSVEVAQRDRAEELLEATRGKGLLRIAAMHHHLESPAGIVRDDYSVMVDAAATRAWLASQRFHLALHGHQHVDWQDVREIEGWFLSITAAGSGGVARYGRAEWQLQLGYQVIVMDGPASGRRIRREYDPQSREWTAAGRGAAVQKLRFGADPAAVSRRPPDVVTRPQEDPAGAASKRGQYAIRIEHLEREIQRHRAEMRLRVAYVAAAVALAVGIAVFLWKSAAFGHLGGGIPTGVGFALALAGTFTFPRSFFGHQDAIDSLLFLRSGYERCERRHDPELLSLLNDRFQKLV